MYFGTLELDLIHGLLFTMFKTFRVRDNFGVEKYEALKRCLLGFIPRLKKMVLFGGAEEGISQ